MPTERTSQSEANKNKDKLNQSWDKDKRSTEFGDTNDPNYDPSLQNSGVDPGKPSNPNVPTQRNMDQEETGLQTAVVDTDRLKASGKRVHGLPNEPIVNVHPVSGNNTTKSEPQQISDAQGILLGEEIDSQYSDLEAGDGYLIPVEPNRTVDQTILEAYKQVHRLNEYWSIPEVNEEGEEISDQVIVHEFKRNDDGTIQLGDKGQPITGANHTLRKRRLPVRLYAVKSVMKDDDKISSDGALIVRVL